jgi:site-specific DNA-methyltransferase (adenine-specific)
MAITYYNESLEGSSKYIKDKSVDLFFLDPPYFISGKSKDVDLENGDRGDWDCQWNNIEEYNKWTESYLKLAYKQLKEEGSIYVCISWQNSYIIHTLLEKIGFIVLNRITWKRDKGRGAKTNWKSMHEDVFFAVKNKNKYTFNIDDVKIIKKVVAPYRNEDKTPKDWWVDENGEKVRLTYPGNLWDEFCVPYWSMKEVKSYAKTKKTPDNFLLKHNTQKPKDLVKKIITASSNAGDLVVDYFSGSGTTAIGAEELGRNSIVFDINKNCIQMLEERIKNELNQNNTNPTI